MTPRGFAFGFTFKETARARDGGPLRCQAACPLARSSVKLQTPRHLVIHVLGPCPDRNAVTADRSASVPTCSQALRIYKVGRAALACRLHAARAGARYSSNTATVLAGLLSRSRFAPSSPGTIGRTACHHSALPTPCARLDLAKRISFHCPVRSWPRPIGWRAIGWRADPGYGR